MNAINERNERIIKDCCALLGCKSLEIAINIQELQKSSISQRSERKEINDNFDVKKLILDVIEGLLERSEPSDYGAKAYKLRRETEMTWNQIEKELDVNQAIQLAKSFATRRSLPWPPR